MRGRNFCAEAGCSELTVTLDHHVIESEGDVRPRAGGTFAPLTHHGRRAIWIAGCQRHAIKTRRRHPDQISRR